jgi:hypothetical protein
MRFAVVAAFALAPSVPADAQTILDLSTATPVAGNWSYAPANDGSEAVFANASGYPQLWIHCSRATRQVSVARNAAAGAPTMSVWTSSQSRSVASSFNAASARLTITLANYDPLLDALATSRARIGVAVGSEPPLVVPVWPQIARVVEDCRA